MVLLAEKHKLLWFGPMDMPENVLAAIDGGWNVTACDSHHLHPRQLDAAEIILIAPPDDFAEGGFDAKQLSALLDRIDRSGAVAVLLLPTDSSHWNLLTHRRGQFILADIDAPPSELSARIESAAALQPTIKHLQTDISAVRGFGVGAAGNLDEFDEEMRLAAKLQRDFLPRMLPEVGPVRFSALFRPASWVSGDIYDVFRLDETHIGFYIADVVGHGMPAALLTMFIKKALQTKQIDGDQYNIVPPDKALTSLNADICEQNLSSCQFCTAAYGIIDTDNLLLQYALGGHPRPLLFADAADADADVQRLDAVGALLGVFPEETFSQQEIHLHPGCRVVIFSDGAEEMLSDDPDSGDSVLMPTLQSLRSLQSDEMMLHLARQIDEHRQAGRRDDDVTILAMDITR